MSVDPPKILGWWSIVKGNTWPVDVGEPLETSGIELPEEAAG